MPQIEHRKRPLLISDPERGRNSKEKEARVKAEARAKA